MLLMLPDNQTKLVFALVNQEWLTLQMVSTDDDMQM